jgi:hypothetical protein
MPPRDVNPPQYDARKPGEWKHQKSFYSLREKQLSFGQGVVALVSCYESEGWLRGGAVA